MSLSKNFVNKKKRKLNNTPVNFIIRDLLYSKWTFKRVFLEAPENLSTYEQFIAELVIFDFDLSFTLYMKINPELITDINVKWNLQNVHN